MLGRAIAVSQQAELLESRALLSVVWTPQGPTTSQNGQVEGIADGEVVGAVHAVLAHPTDADIMYVGSVNGGVWKTTSATASDPTWTPMFDQNSSMSIGAMTMDPANSDRVLVGFGRYSSFLDANNGLVSFGGNLTGVALTSNAGNSWTEINDPLLQGQSISAVAVRGDMLLAAANPFAGSGGLFRRADASSGFILVSGATYADTTSSGLPVGGVFDLVGDPTNSNRFYATVTSQGLYRSDDAGVHWTLVSGSDPTLNTVFTSPNNNNAEMSVASNGRIYVGVMLNARANYLGYSDDQGGTWTAMDLPQTAESNGDIEGLSPREKPGSQGIRHFSIVADRNNPNTVYVGGDRQDNPFPNFIGANDFTARLFRGDTTVAPTGAVPSPQWEHLTHSNSIAAIPGGGTASGSAPHADSRDMVFDANGNLIEVDDGGIYRRTSPQDNTGDWSSIIGNLAVTEMHSVAYDSNSNILISGNQDTGATYQLNPGGSLWTSLDTADGGDVAVDNVSLAGSGLSIRYSSRQNLGGFQRTVWDTTNTQVTVEGVTGSVIPAVTSGATFAAQFVTPVVLNEITPLRLILGGRNSVYESADRGNTITEIGVGIVAEAVAYGGRSGGLNNPDVLYVSQAGTVFVRTTAGGALTAAAALPIGIDRITDIELDPNDWNRAWVVDNDQVFQTTDAGATWSNVTGDLAMTSIRSIEFLDGQADRLLVGGLGGVFVATTAALTTWTRLGTGLPNTLVWDMEYDAADDVLAVGTLGRGAWTAPRLLLELEPPPPFATALGASGNDVPVGIALAEDGGYAVVGNTLSFNGDNQDIWLSRFDARGNLLWTRTYAGGFFVQLAGTLNPDDPGNSFGFLTFDGATDIAAAPDGGFVITGRSQVAPGNASDGLVFQVNSVGDVVGATLHSFGHSVVDSLNSVTDNGSLIAGTVSIGIEFPGPFITTYGSTTCLDINGTLYSGFDSSNGTVTFGHHSLSQVIQPSGGGEAAIGNENGGIYDYTYVARSGGPGLTGIAFGDGLETGLSITETPADPDHPSMPRYFGTLSVTGVLDINATSNVIVRKLDAATLLPVWEVVLNGAANTGRSYGRIAALPDGGFLVAAITSVSSLFGTGSSSNIMLTKLNTDGEIVWSKVYGGRGTDGALFSGETLDLIVTPDGYAFTVATDSFGTDDSLTTSRDFWVVKTDLNGDIPVMTGLMQDVTSSMTATPVSTSYHFTDLAALNFNRFKPLTPEEIAAENYHPVIRSELFNFGGTIIDLTANNRVGIVPRVQSTVTFNSGAAQFQQDNYQIDESDSAFVDVIVTRADATHGAYGKASVNYTITPNGSTSATEFLAAPAELFQYATPGFNSFHVDFEDGELTKAIRVLAVNDGDFDPGDSVTITLSDADPLNDIALGARASTVVSFGDTTPFPGRAQFSAATYTVNEYKTTATITVNRVDGDGLLEVDYATVTGGTATAGTAEVAGSDYGSVSGTLTFNPGVTSQTFTIPLFDDAQTEGDETITLQLSNIVNGELGTPITAVLTIHDVEAPAPLAIDARVNGRIAFSRHSGDFVTDLFTMNSNGTGLTNITNTESAGEFEAAWSPDGSRLAFSIFDFSADSAHGIYVSSADGTGRTRLTTSISDHSPVWSPDGTRIAYVSQEGLVLMNADGSSADSILSGSVTMPIWSPDGTHLIYQRTIGGVVGLYEIGVDGFGERQILTNFSGIFDYSYSPNGMQLIVNGSLDEVQAIFRANIDGSGTPERLIDVTFNDFTGMFSVGQPALSPDGNRLAFVNLSSRIAVSNVNGSSQSVLTSGATDSDPAWQPLAADLVAPSIVSVTPSPALIADANTGDSAFTIAVVYDEPMDPTIKPTLSFPDEDPGASITLNAAQSDWTDSSTYVARYNVGSAQAFLFDIDVQISDAKDTQGNVQASQLTSDVFDIAIDGPEQFDPPYVAAFTRSDPAEASTSSDLLIFHVEFSGFVDYFTIDPTDFVVVGSTAIIQFVNEVPGFNGLVYEIGVAGGNLTSYEGEIGLNISPDTDIADYFGSPLVEAEPQIDETYQHTASQVLPGPAQVSLPAGGSYELLVDGDELVVRVQGGVELFRRAESLVTHFTIAGSPEDDTVLVRNSGVPVLTPTLFLGNTGNDFFDASLAAGSVTLSGEAGNDSLMGGAAADFIGGGDGNDVLTGGAGSDTINGGAGVDILLEIQDFSMVLSGNSTSGTLQMTLVNGAVQATDALTFIEAASLRGGTSHNRMDLSAWISPSITTLIGGGGRDTIIGSPGRDRITTFSSGRDFIQGGAGNDTIATGSGDDTIDGGEGNDSIQGQGGNDSVIGGNGDDNLAGSEGNDTVIGGEDNDKLFGLQDNDLLDGGNGNDSLIGSSGDDTLLGGAGKDLLRGDAGIDSINGGAGTDRIDEQINADVTIIGVQIQSVVLGNESPVGVERIVLTGGTSANLFNGRLATVELQLTGNGGNDTLLAGSSNDTVRGNDGNDVLSGGGGTDVIEGGSGTDFWVESANANFTVTGLQVSSTASGTETGIDIERIALEGGVGNNNLNASGATVPVLLLGGLGNDTLTGGSGNDTLTGGFRGDTTVAGSDGIDSLDGGAGMDTLKNDPSDTLSNTGGDTLQADVFSLLLDWLDLV